MRSRVGRASMNEAQRRRSECQVPGKWDVDETMGSDPIWKDGGTRKLIIELLDYMYCRIRQRGGCSTRDSGDQS